MWGGRGRQQFFWYLINHEISRTMFFLHIDNTFKSWFQINHVWVGFPRIEILPVFGHFLEWPIRFGRFRHPHTITNNAPLFQKSLLSTVLSRTCLGHYTTTSPNTHKSTALRILQWTSNFVVFMVNFSEVKWICGGLGLRTWGNLPIALNQKHNIMHILKTMYANNRLYNRLLAIKHFVWFSTGQ